MQTKNYTFWSAETAESEQTYLLNLDKEFNPFSDFLFGACYVNYEKSTFLGGEPHFRINNHLYNSKLFISQRIDSVADLMDIVLANDAAKRLGAKEISLFIPYFPAARQDRICNKGEAFTLKIFADLINGCEFKKVYILTPHSDVTPALLNNVVIMDDLDMILDVANDLGGTEMNIVCPDAGAGKRVQKAIEHLSKNNPTNRKYSMVRCEKIRDVKDGRLKEFYVGEGLIKGAPTLILDDINCMGGTFLGLGEKLIAAGCGTLALFTVHSDCQIGIGNILDSKFDHFYTTNSKKNNAENLKSDKLTCIKIQY